VTVTGTEGESVPVDCSLPVASIRRPATCLASQPGSTVTQAGSSMSQPGSNICHPGSSHPGSSMSQDPMVATVNTGSSSHHHHHSQRPMATAMTTSEQAAPVSSADSDDTEAGSRLTNGAAAPLNLTSVDKHATTTTTTTVTTLNGETISTTDSTQQCPDWDEMDTSEDNDNDEMPATTTTTTPLLANGSRSSTAGVACCVNGLTSNNYDNLTNVSDSDDANDVNCHSAAMGKHVTVRFLISPSFFHCKLKTFLFVKSYPPSTSGTSSD